jgi:hypothetical protein
LGEGFPMDAIPIGDAKDIATRRRAVGVLIVAIGGGKIGTTSYGMTRRHCDAMKRVNEQIAALVADGTIYIPPVLTEADRG